MRVQGKRGSGLHAAGPLGFSPCSLKGKWCRFLSFPVIAFCLTGRLDFFLKKNLFLGTLEKAGVQEGPARNSSNYKAEAAITWNSLSHGVVAVNTKMISAKRETPTKGNPARGKKTDEDSLFPLLQRHLLNPWDFGLSGFLWGLLEVPPNDGFTLGNL